MMRFLPSHVNEMSIGWMFQDLHLAMQMIVHKKIMVALEKTAFSNKNQHKYAMGRVFMLKVEHITTEYGRKQVPTDVSFELAKWDFSLWLFTM
jgi:ABC-type branched-subunit amino acid transport system ATPase component